MNRAKVLHKDDLCPPFAGPAVAPLSPEADLLVLVGQVLSSPAVVVEGPDVAGGGPEEVLGAAGRRQVREAASVLGHLTQQTSIGIEGEKKRNLPSH